MKINEEDLESKKGWPKVWKILICGLYYKHVTIVNDASSSISKWRYNLERHFWQC